MATREQKLRAMRAGALRHEPTILLSTSDRERLQDAINADDTLQGSDRARLQGALDRTLTGTPLPTDHTDLGDGTTDEEIVAIALDYYYG